MFTGIVEEIGKIESISRGRNSAVLTISAEKVLQGTKIGDSIAVNGICLTVTKLMNNAFQADVMHETLSRSSLAEAVKGSEVNLERAMAADGRFGGHIVAGHVDGTGTIAGKKKDDNAIWYKIEASPHIMRYVVEKAYWNLIAARGKDLQDSAKVEIFRKVVEAFQSPETEKVFNETFGGYFIKEGWDIDEF